MPEYEDTPEIIKSITGSIRQLAAEETAQLKLAQLQLLTDPSRDRNITWEQLEAVKTSFFGAYTYTTTEVSYIAGPKMITAIRGHGIIAYIRDLDRLGYLGEARAIIYAATASQENFQ